MLTTFKNMNPLLWAKLYLTAAACGFVIFSVTFSKSYNLFFALLVLSYFFFFSAKVRNAIRLSTIEKSLIVVMCLFIAAFIMEVVLFDENPRILDKPAKALLFIPLIPLLNAIKIDYRYLIGSFFLGSGMLLVSAGYDKFILEYARAGEILNPIQFGAISIAIASTAFAFTAIFKSNSIKGKLLLALTILLATSGIIAGILSHSRGSIISLPIIAILISLLYVSQSHLNRMKVAVVAGTLICASIILIINSPLKERFQRSIDNALAYSEGTKTNTSTGIRFGLWKVSMEAGSMSPITGIGNTEFLRYKDQQVELGHVGEELLRFNNSHNTYANAFARRGLIGLSTIILFLAFPVYVGLSIWRQSSDALAPYAVSLTACGSVFFIANITQEIILLNNGAIMFTGLLVILTSLLAERMKAYELETEPSTVPPNP